MRESKPWFAPKRYGYGAGLPIAWQGWVVLVLYLLICFGAVSGLPHLIANPGALALAILVVTGIATIVLVLICMAKTRGGWHWRWGGKD